MVVVNVESERKALSVSGDSSSRSLFFMMRFSFVEIHIQLGTADAPYVIV